MNRVDGKVALVTGGGAGIGRATCKVLAKAGAKIVVSGRNIDSVEETAQMITQSGGEAVAIKLDVSSEADWQNAIDFTLARFKKLNILVNNAGIYTMENFEEVSLASWRKVMSINFDGVFLGIRAAILAMKDNEETNSIINISSTGGLRPYQDVPYCSAKGGMKNLTKCAAIECRKKGYKIRVNTLYPGAIKDGMLKEVKETEEYSREFLSQYPTVDRIGEALDMAKGILFLASEDSSYITGTDLVIDGGLLLDTKH